MRRSRRSRPAAGWSSSSTSSKRSSTRPATRRSGASFIDLLTTERENLKVVLAMRADHYGHCAAYPQLARLVGTNQVLVGPLTHAELASVIERPAQRVGLRVEPDLTEALLAELGDEPGSLPLLSTALLELWQARHAGRLTLAAYRSRGGVQGAVARLAEGAYAGLSEDERAIARSIFLRLAGTGEGEGIVRRRVPLSEFDQSDQRVARRADQAHRCPAADGRRRLRRGCPRGTAARVAAAAALARGGRRRPAAASASDRGGARLASARPRVGRSLSRRPAGRRAGVVTRTQPGAQPARARFPRAEPARV